MFSPSLNSILILLTLTSLLFTIADFSKIKKENKNLRDYIESIKKVLSDQIRCFCSYCAIGPFSLLIKLRSEVYKFVLQKEVLHCEK